MPSHPVRAPYVRRGVPGRLLAVLVAAAVVVLVAGCGGSDGSGDSGAARLPADWDRVREEAQGQIVRWWMYGGDERVNRYVDEYVTPAAAEQGVTLERVPVADTADAVQRVLAEREAGRASGGGVDLIWINGENFALGKEAGLWREDWVSGLPAAAGVDLTDPSLARDFGVPIDGQEMPWSRAAFVYAAAPGVDVSGVRTVEDLLEYARANPGRITYPAPPDFTGSAFVRQVVAALGEDEAMRALRELAPSLHDDGRSQPKSEAELNRLFGDGEVDIAMSYDPSFVLSEVRAGRFPVGARPFALRETLQNASYVTIPANASSVAGAAVVVDLLLSPRLQAVKADPGVLGLPTVLDPSRLTPAERELLAPPAGDAEYLLSPDELGAPLAELPPADVQRIEDRWQREVLR